MDLVSLRDIEAYEPRLMGVKDNRGTAEYYFTLTPIVNLYVLEKWPEADSVTYVDADLFFFSSPAPIFDELAQSSIGIIEHRFPQALQHLTKVGIYNVGWVTFRNDQNAKACLRWWRERCLECCTDVSSESCYADQKYLDEWPHRFDGVKEIRNKGANLAPWNIAGHHVTANDGEVYVDSDRLIFFHFHRFRCFAPFVYDTGLYGSGVRLTDVTRDNIMWPYIRSLEYTKHMTLEGQVAPKWERPLGLRGLKGGHFTSFVRELRALARLPHKFVAGSLMFSFERSRHR